MREMSVCVKTPDELVDDVGVIHVHGGELLCVYDNEMYSTSKVFVNVQIGDDVPCGVLVRNGKYFAEDLKTFSASQYRNYEIHSGYTVQMDVSEGLNYKDCYHCETDLRFGDSDKIIQLRKGDIFFLHESCANKLGELVEEALGDYEKIMRENI